MILANIFIKIGIVAGAVILFLVSYILNKNTKAPKIDEKIKKCSTCTNESCVIKLSEIEEIKAEYEVEIKKHEEGIITSALDSCEQNKQNMQDKQNEKQDNNE